MKLDSYAQSSLDVLQNCSLLTAQELSAVRRLCQPDSPFATEVGLAETLHMHIKVDNTHELPVNDLFSAGGRLDHSKDGFVKYLLPGGINAIFSHIKVSQDELLETQDSRRPRPFLDHIGIDMREETDPSGKPSMFCLGSPRSCTIITLPRADPDSRFTAATLKLQRSIGYIRRTKPVIQVSR